MDMKRSMVAVAAGLILVATFATGCSSSKSGTQATATTVATDDTSATGDTTPGATVTTLAVGDGAVDRHPDPVAFCVAFGGVQTVMSNFGNLDFSDGLAIVAAPAQAHTAAVQMRQTAPDDVNDMANNMADILEQAANDITVAAIPDRDGNPSLDKLQAAMKPVVSLQTDDSFKPLYAWVVKNCTADVLPGQ